MPAASCPDVPSAASRPGDLVAVLAALGFPSLATWIYFDVFSGQKIMMPIYAASKVIQFAFPLVWVLAVRRARIPWSPGSWKGAATGTLSGLGILALCLALYFGLLRGGPVLAGTPGSLREKLDGLGLETPAAFFFMAAFLSVLHSFLEEYYWRWFVFGSLRLHARLTLAVLVSSLGFMAHHVIVLDQFFPEEYFWTATVGFSLCIAIGGAFWAWLYARTGSLVGPWLSHMVVDVAIMICGYDLAFRPAAG